MKLYYVDIPNRRNLHGRHGQYVFDRGTSELMSRENARKLNALLGGYIQEVDLGDLDRVDMELIARNADAVRNAVADAEEAEDYQDLRDELANIHPGAEEREDRQVQTSRALTKTQMGMDTSGNAQQNQSRDEVADAMAKREAAIEAAARNEKTPESKSVTTAENQENAEGQNEEIETDPTVENKGENPDIEKQEEEEEVTEKQVNALAAKEEIEYPGYNEMKAAISKANKDESVDYNSKELIGGSRKKDDIKKAYLALKLMQNDEE